MTIHIGITGTRLGCNRGQYEDLLKFMSRRPEAEIDFHHGDCVGVDAEGFALARRYGMTTIAHPPIDPNTTTKEDQ